MGLNGHSSHFKYKTKYQIINITINNFDNATKRRHYKAQFITRIAHVLSWAPTGLNMLQTNTFTFFAKGPSSWNDHQLPTKMEAPYPRMAPGFVTIEVLTDPQRLP